jgi:hypothetical protein
MPMEGPAAMPAMPIRLGAGCGAKRGGGALLVIAWLALAGIAAAQTPGSGSPGLDRLLRLPDASEYSTDEKGGASRSEWRQRFSEARGALAKAEKSLEQSQAKLAAAAGEKSQWQFSPPGVPSQGNEESSSSYQLREEVRRQRGEVDRARARLRELDVQANLAGVPEEWRTSSTDARSGDAPGDGSETGPQPRR